LLCTIFTLLLKVEVEDKFVGAVAVVEGVGEGGFDVEVEV
jgi:hypothetical protein